MNLNGISTPLTSIRGYAKMLEGWGLSEPKTTEESVAAIKRESDRMVGLVEDLLALARGDEGPPLSPENTNLATIAEESVEAARASAGGKVAIEVLGGGAAAAVDRARVRQAIGILLDNAVKYTPEGGRVEVRTFEDGGWAAVAIEDTGVGISEGQLPLVFERFHRIDEARGVGGAGLGLAIARQIAEAHGGGSRPRANPAKAQPSRSFCRKGRPARRFRARRGSKLRAAFGRAVNSEAHPPIPPIASKTFHKDRSVDRASRLRILMNS
jgi:signal transduction histidine kinase